MSVDFWTKLLDYGITALIAVFLVVALYKLFFRVLEAVKDNSKVIAEVTKALDGNTRTIENLGNAIHGMASDRAFVEGLGRTLTSHTQTLTELHKATMDLAQRVTTLCTLVELEAKK